MTPQQTADEMLLRWQQQRHADIGKLTQAILDDALDLFEIWMERPTRRIEFSTREREDISEALKALGNLLSEIDGVRADCAA